MNLPKLTKRQQDILTLLYRHRYLNRIQIQQLMHHKDYKTINLWLKDLRAKQYVTWIYSTDFAEKTKPAVYFLGLNGIRLLHKLGTYPIDDLRKRYRDATRSQSFIDRSLLLADCCLDVGEVRPDGVYCTYETEADYRGGGYYQFLLDDGSIHPHLCYAKYTAQDELIAHYVLEVFDENLPRYRIRKRLTDYLTYLEGGEWQNEVEEGVPLNINLVCQRTADLIYAKRRTRGLLADTWRQDDENRPHIRFTTTDKVKTQGVTTKIWEEA